MDDTLLKKLQSRETIAALTALVVFVLTIFGVNANPAEIDKVVTGAVASVAIVALVYSRTQVKVAHIQNSARDSTTATIAQDVAFRLPVDDEEP
ncbi:MAG: hypothetical protein ACTHQM_25695 [Thermoanaerobaculia bacterium]